MREAVEVYKGFLSGEKIASFSDPDARWGFARKDEPFLGYKVVASCDETGIFTSLEVLPGNCHELDGAKDIIEDLSDKKMKPLKVVGDKAYDASPFREQLAKEGIKPYIPAKHDLNRLKLKGFRYEGNCLICPMGKTSIGSSPHKKNGLLYYFSGKDCGVCPIRKECLSATQKRKVCYVEPEVFKYRARGIKHALRIRKTIERAFADCKVWHRMARARYRGLSRVTIQVILTLIVVNAKKMAKRALHLGSTRPYLANATT